VSQVFAGQKVGVDEHLWLVTFMHHDLGYFDDETCRLEPIDNPFDPKFTHVSGIRCYPCLRNRPANEWLLGLDSHMLARRAKRRRAA
jgi:putative transposase